MGSDDASVELRPFGFSDLRFGHGHFGRGLRDRFSDPSVLYPARYSVRRRRHLGGLRRREIFHSMSAKRVAGAKERSG